MKVGKLMTLLKAFDPETEVVLEKDENGWFALELVEAETVEGLKQVEEPVVNLGHYE